jgi:hypothetical protein
MDILENEQRLKLSTIIALTAVLLTFIGGYINIKSTQTEFRIITALERQKSMKLGGFSKFDFKLDKISESLNQLKVDMASKRVDETKNNR